MNKNNNDNDITSHSHHRIAVRLLTSAAVAVLVFGLPAVVSRVSPAQAQGISISVEFHDALEPYGHWRRHSRWGEVWIPNRPRGWQPYRNGHWVYTDEWGWYWVANRDEGNWGWVAYHYGRWVSDPDEGWIWVPGKEWAPAWVDWRRGADYVGWSPLPPDDYVVETRENPEFWLFVRPGNLAAPVLGTVYLPSRQTNIYIQNTVIVNRTVVVQSSGRTFAVNPGIQPAYIAAASRRPLPTFQVKPRVLAGTQGIKGAVIVSAKDIHASRIAKSGARGGRTSVTPFRETVVRAKTASIAPAAKVPPPQALPHGEKGQLGARPPRAAQGAKVVEPTAPAEKPGTAPPARTSVPNVKPATPPQTNAPTPAPAIKPATPPTSAPPPAVRHAPPPAVRHAPPPAARHAPPPAVRHAPPPTVRHAPPPAARHAPPPAVRHAPPPAARHAPPPAARHAPPPAVRHAPPPAARHAPPPAARHAPPKKPGEPTDEKK
jgi:hypothetical protein